MIHKWIAYCNGAQNSLCANVYVGSLQKQVSVMSMNLSAKLDELQQRGDRQLETTVALCEIRTQLQELTKSVESCQSEVSEVKRDMVAIKVYLKINYLRQKANDNDSLFIYLFSINCLYAQSPYWAFMFFMYSDLYSLSFKRELFLLLVLFSMSWIRCSRWKRKLRNYVNT